MRTRSVKCAALLAVVVVVPVGLSGPAWAAKGAAAAPNTLTLTDVKGDANAINGQSREPRPWPGPGLGDHSGPIQKADSDIVSLALASTGTTTKVKGKKVFTCTGFTATMTLAAPVASDAHNRVTGVGVVNSLLWLRYQTDSSGTWSYITYSDGTSPLKGRYLNNAAKLDGNKIIFTVTESDLRAVGEKLASFKMSALGADTRTSTATPDHPAPLDTPRSYTALAWDTMDEDSSKSFTPCPQKPPVTFEASGSFAMSVSATVFARSWGDFWNITSNEFRNTCSIPASQGVDGYVVELSDAISAVTSTVLVSGSDATGFGHDFDMYFFDADCASTGASTGDSTGGRPPGSNYGDELGVFPAGTKYVLVVAGGGPGLEFTLHATEKR